MFDIDDVNSHSMDGFPSNFFETHHDLLGKYVLEAVNHLFSLGNILEEWNLTLWVLIPKIASPKEANDLMHISLYNTLYNSALMCLVKRLKSLLKTLLMIGGTWMTIF